VVKCSPRVLEALGSIPNTARKIMMLQDLKSPSEEWTTRLGQLWTEKDFTITDSACYIRIVSAHCRMSSVLEKMGSWDCLLFWGLEGTGHAI
jgi:hypothetical protein